MRVIEKRWKQLEAGHTRIHEFASQLDLRWKRPLQVAHRRKFDREYAAWRRNRRIILLLTFGFLLGCSLLCGFAYGAEDLNLLCLYSFGAFGLLLTGTLFAYWRRRNIRSIFNRPELETYAPPSRRLVELWWKNLGILPEPSGDEGVETLLDLLKENLPDSYVAVPEILTSIKKATDTDILLLGPSGIWAFEVKHWYGTVYRENDAWWHTPSSRRIDHRQESGEPKQGPDEQWNNQAREIMTTLRRRRPDLLPAVREIHGGIVFSNPGAILDRSNIQGNRAPYGKPSHWLGRIQKTQAVEGFTMANRLRALDALIEYALSIEREEITPVSALKLAEWSHEKVSQELTEFVALWTK